MVRKLLFNEVNIAVRALDKRLFVYDLAEFSKSSSYHCFIRANPFGQSGDSVRFA
jgi:hypothetical protein